jgi:hypothetical protein
VPLPTGTNESTRRIAGHFRAPGLFNSRSNSTAFISCSLIGNDGVWDAWQLESPNMVWYFRGAPHVHTWVNIRKA